MKTNVKLLSAIALIASACTTGSMVRSSSYSDDVYFTPGDNPPVVVNTLPPNKQQVTRPGITTESRQQEAGKIVDNYNLEKKDGNLESDNYVYNDETSESDTTYESDEEAKFLINNYDDPEEISYTTRIRTFYNPYCYDPYWDSYYTPGWGFNWNMGFGGWGGGFYSGWNNPFYYGGFYDPFYSYGYGGFYPYGGYYGGYYGGGYWGGYYGGGYGGGHWGGYTDNRDRFYGRQNYTGSGRSNAVRYSGSRGTALGSSTINTGGRGQLGTSGTTRRSADVLNGGGTRQQAGTAGSTRQAGTRYTVDPNVTRSGNLSGQSGTRSAETLTNLRRGQSANYQRGGINATNPTTRQSSSGSSQNYTPTYSRPRTNTQATYNSGTTRQYARPQSSGNSGSNVSRSYSRPQGSGSAGTVGRSSAGSSYQRGSSSSSGSNAQSAPTRSSSSQSYSAPSRSSSGSSYSGGGSSSGSSSGGSSSGSSSGGGRRR